MDRAPVKIRRVDFYPDDWLAGTRGMSEAECGLYWNLCALMYALGECPIELEKARKTFGGRNFDRLLRRLLKRGKVTAEGSLIAARRVPEELLRRRRGAPEAHLRPRRGPSEAPLTTDKPLTDSPRARAIRRARDNLQSSINNNPPNPPRGARSKMNGKEKEPLYGPLRDPVEIAKDLGLRK
jgi:hypothetical protein